MSFNLPSYVRYPVFLLFKTAIYHSESIFIVNFEINFALELR